MYRGLAEKLTLFYFIMEDIMDNEIVKTTPPIGVSTLSLMGIPLSDWVYIVTIMYVLIQIWVLLYKTFFKKEECNK
ncbi:uncharacterized protein BN587_00902 [Phascolarctobacterium succinatutens CAG:287]|jgi:hypothetical protein|uniref:Uncharacterized protein n=2 Tax=Phascolarctobacterium succinatutens TaxID=626940 RepID=R6WZ72_9FIRM|nr:uncharacterized protein BN587_00902 [Phascolarctobacterium succinatutens CAG:287]